MQSFRYLETLESPGSIKTYQQEVALRRLKSLGVPQELIDRLVFDSTNLLVSPEVRTEAFDQVKKLIISWGASKWQITPRSAERVLNGEISLTSGLR